jgi:hypothetical protein
MIPCHSLMSRCKPFARIRYIRYMGTNILNLQNLFQPCRQGSKFTFLRYADTLPSTAAGCHYSQDSFANATIISEKFEELSC